MNPADETAAKIETTERRLAGAVGGSDDKVDEQLPVSLEDFQHTNNQKRPVEDLHSLLLRISHHLDYQTSERKNIYYRLLAIDEQTKAIDEQTKAIDGQTKAIDGQTKAIDGQTKRVLENQTKMRASRAFARYLVAICIGVAGTLAWQSYGEATKQIIATKAPELGWSPETKQMIASWVEQLGWTKPTAGTEKTAVQPSVLATPQAATVALTTETVAPKPPVAASLDPEQVKQIAESLAALRQTVEQLATSQDQMARVVNKVLAADVEILLKFPTPPPQPPVAPARRPMPVPPPASRALMPPR
jgi:hypothetical protein